MNRFLRPILIVGPLVLLALSAMGALANMPALGPKPGSPSPSACRAWAARQNEEALYMWGMEEAGGSSNKVAVSRLTDSCMGKKPPEIVGFGSSVGFDDAFCNKHRSAKLCRNR